MFEPAHHPSLHIFWKLHRDFPLGPLPHSILVAVQRLTHRHPLSVGMQLEPAPSEPSQGLLLEL